VSLTNGVDIQCYNYTLDTPFSCAPGVAIGTSLVMQLSTTSRVNTVPIFSSPSRQSAQTIMGSFPSLCALTGDTLSGLKSPSPSLLKGPHKSKLDTTKLILPHYHHASQASPSSLSSPSSTRMLPSPRHLPQWL
jgi:hypothetical protein